MQTIQLKYAKSLGGGFDGDPKKAWNCVEYTNRNNPAVFVGMYDLRDYIALWRHKGKAWVFWCGSDISNLDNGFMCNNGKLMWLSKILPGFKSILLSILNKADHWCENQREQGLLSKNGVKASVNVSFFGRKESYKVEYKWSPNTQVYISASEGRQIEYGFDIIEQLAGYLPDITFHFYGATWNTKQFNIIVHGKVPLHRMNREISKMHCGLRLNKFDGFSEITAKSILWGQYPITYIPYPNIPWYSCTAELKSLLKDLRNKKEPNTEVRDYYLNKINKFPWSN